MGFGEAIKTCFGKYASFTGRARRSEFWYFWLFTIIVSFILSIIDNVIGWTSNFGGQSIDVSATFSPLLSGNVGALSTIWSLAVLLPMISVTVRRLHDTDRTGWWWWILLVPCVGWIVLLVFVLLDSTPGDNRFGPNPKGYAPAM